jgi:hypothetical protein
MKNCAGNELRGRIHVLSAEGAAGNLPLDSRAGSILGDTVEGGNDRQSRVTGGRSAAAQARSRERPIFYRGEADALP